jgi:condensin complex subunit 3
LTLDIIQHESTAKQVLQGYFELVPHCFSNGFSESVFDSIIPETALIIRAYCEYQREKSNIDSILPDLTRLVQILEHIAQAQDPDAAIHSEFIQRQLLSILSYMDPSDESGRRIACQLFKHMLLNPATPDTLISPILKCSRHYFMDQVQDLALFVAELICDLRDIFSMPASDALQASSLSQVQILAYARCMEITKALLLLAAAPPITISLATQPVWYGLLNEIIIPAVNSNLVLIQTHGLECLGLLCSLERTPSICLQYIDLFFDFFKLGSQHAKLSSLKILFDVFLLFGPDLTRQSSDILVSSLYNIDKDIQAIACEGFSKLILRHSEWPNKEQVLEALLFLYYHPSTSHPPRMKQCLAYFVHAYSATDKISIARVFVSLLKTLAPVVQEEYAQSSPLDLVSIGQQLLVWTDETGEACPHMEIAVSLCSELSSTRHAKVFASLLSKLNLRRGTKAIMDQLLASAGQLIKIHSHDKTTVMYIKKFAGMLVAMEHESG